jgi:hypothetical protein
MSECIIVPKLGTDLSVAVEHPTFENALIIEYRGSRIAGIHDVTPDSLYRLKPKPPPEYYKKETVMRQQPLTKSLAPGHLVQGLNPFEQLIWATAREHGSVTEEDIVRSLILDYRVLPNTSHSRRAIKALIKKMRSEAFLLQKKDKKYATGLIPTGGMYLIPYKEGYNPMEYQIVSYVENRGIVARSEIQEYIMRHLEWTTNPGDLDKYIERVIKKGAIRELQDGYFEYQKPLEQFKGAVSKVLKG